MAKVYSYVRFSDVSQAKGTSIARQEGSAEAWVRQHPEHELDTEVSLQDLGRSAFHGINLDPHKGDLGKFIALIKKGTIPKNSILLIDSLDRFSRMPLRISGKIFYEIIMEGINIQICNPYLWIDKTNVDNDVVTMTISMYLQAAYNHSAELSRKLKIYWHEMRKNKKSFQKRCPAWLEWDAEKETYKIKQGASKIIKLIFQRTIEGVGERQLMKELDKYPSFGNANRWNSGYIGKIIASRAVVGEWQPSRLDKTLDEPIPNFFPQIITEGEWLRANEARKRRARAKLKSPEKFINLFCGLVYCENDGSVMHLHTVVSKTRKTVRRFLSYDHICGKKDACKIGMDYNWFQYHLLLSLDNLTSDDLASETTNELPNLISELEEINKKLANLQIKLENADEDVVDALLSAIASQKKKRKLLKIEIDKAKTQEEVSGVDGLNQLHILSVLDSVDKIIKLRSVLAELISRIDLKLRKEGNKCMGTATVTFRNGYQQKVEVGAGQLWGHNIRTPEQQKKPLVNVDIDDNGMMIFS